MESVTSQLKTLLDRRVSERTVFFPAPRPTVVKRNLKLEYTPDEYARIADYAKRYGLSMKAFAKQAIAFAVERLESERGPG